MNRGDEAADDDVYQVELNKLKAQFESAARVSLLSYYFIFMWIKLKC